MIRAVTVADFQSIRRAHIELGGWTSLVGESDVGKSAMVRAITAGLTNWRGDHFIRHGEKQCSVTFALDDTTCVEWAKTRGKSGEYFVTSPTGEVAVFTKTGSEVPPEVAALLNVTVQVSGDDFTPGLQQQHDPPFLLAETPRRRAQILGEFDGGNILLVAEGQLRRDQREQQTAATGYLAAAVAAEETLTTFEWVDGAVTLLDAAKDAQGTALAYQTRTPQLHGMAAGLTAFERLSAEYRICVEAIDGPLTESKGWLANAALADPSGMAALATRLRAVAPVDAAVVLPVLEFDRIDAMGALADATALAGRQRNYDAALVAAMDDEVGDARAALDAVVGEVCPVCGSPLTAEGVGL